jgi:replicative DNA helicase
MVDIQSRLDHLASVERLEEEARKLSVVYSNTNLEEDQVSYLKKKLEAIEAKRMTVKATKAITAFDLIKDVDSRPNVPRYETGVIPLDRELNGGIEVGSFVQLAGASFAGKTHLVIEILSNIAQYKKVLFFNFEMGDRRIANRFSKTLLTEESRKNMMIHNSDRELSHIIQEIKTGAKAGIKFFGIDSKMKIEVSDEKDDHKKFSKISASFSKLTQENEIIILLINQMSEEDDKNNRLAFKGSGDQLYDTDIALFYLVDKEQNRTLYCRKNRQDEVNFKIPLKLNEHGKTVDDVNRPLTVHQNKAGQYVAPNNREYGTAETHEYKMEGNY